MRQDIWLVILSVLVGVAGCRTPAARLPGIESTALTAAATRSNPTQPSPTR